MSFTISNIAPEIEHRLIKDFKSIPKYLKVDEIVQYSLPLSYHLLGSRVIQDIYETYPQYRKIIFEQIFDSILNLSFSEMGNYVIQAIIEFDPDKRKIILDQLKNNIFLLAFHDCGTFVIQRLIEKIQKKYLEDIMKELEGHYFIDLAANHNGTYVLQKLIQRQSGEENDKLCLKIINYLIALSKNQYGYYVIEALLNNCSEEIYYKIFYIALNNIKMLIFDEFGNYLIQHFLEKEKGKESYYLKMFYYKIIKSNIFILCKNNYAINVVETAIIIGNELQRKILIDEILMLDKHYGDFIVSLTQDDCGNYIVQLLLEYGDERAIKIITKKIMSIPNIQNDQGPSQYVIKKIKELKRNKKGAFNNLK